MLGARKRIMLTAAPYKSSSYVPKFDIVVGYLEDALDSAEPVTVTNLAECFYDWKKGNLATYKRLKSIPAVAKMFNLIESYIDPDSDV